MNVRPAGSRPIPLHLCPCEQSTGLRSKCRRFLTLLPSGTVTNTSARGKGSLPHLPGQVRRFPLPGRDLSLPLLGAHHVVAQGSSPKRSLRTRVVTINNDLGEPAAQQDLAYPPVRHACWQPFCHTRTENTSQPVRRRPPSQRPRDRPQQVQHPAAPGLPADLPAVCARSRPGGDRASGSGCSLTASAGSSPGGGRQTSHAAPSRWLASRATSMDGTR